MLLTFTKAATSQDNLHHISVLFTHLAGLAAQSLRLPPECEEVGRGAFAPQHGGTLWRVALQLSPEVGQTGEEALQGVGLRGQGVRVASNGTEGVQFIIKVGETWEDVPHVSLDLADALQPWLQGGAALLDLMEEDNKYLTMIVLDLKMH